MSAAFPPLPPEHRAAPTAGPWRVVKRVGGNPSVIDAKGAGICSTGNCRTRSYAESIANARLIAEAPAMLAALRELVTIASAYCSVFPSDNPTAISVARARTAIAAAEGRS